MSYFAASYFAPRYFAPRYWPSGLGVVADVIWFKIKGIRVIAALSGTPTVRC